MKEILRESDIHNLADIIWWMKGYKAGMETECPFCVDHITTLAKLIRNLKAELNYCDKEGIA